MNLLRKLLLHMQQSFVMAWGAGSWRGITSETRTGVAAMNLLGTGFVVPALAGFTRRPTG
jgi:hypothetical protein